jgi:hypothetical protein
VYILDLASTATGGCLQSHSSANLTILSTLNMSRESGSSDSGDSGGSLYTAQDYLNLWEGNLRAYNYEYGYSPNLKGSSTHDSTPSNSKRTIRFTLKSIFTPHHRGPPQSPAKRAVNDDATPPSRYPISLPSGTKRVHTMRPFARGTIIQWRCGFLSFFRCPMNSWPVP